jgi:hypothetical protein
MERLKNGCICTVSDERCRRTPLPSGRTFGHLGE